ADLEVVVDRALVRHLEGGGALHDRLLREDEVELGRLAGRDVDGRSGRRPGAAECGDRGNERYGRCQDCDHRRALNLAQETSSPLGNTVDKLVRTIDEPSSGLDENPPDERSWLSD